MTYIYIVMFLVGVLYTLVSIFITGISGAMHIGGDAGGTHIHGSGHVHGGVDCGTLAHGAGNMDGNLAGSHVHGGQHVDTGGASGHVANGTADAFISLFSILINPIVAVSFLTVFGGIGILGTRYFAWAAIFVFAVSLIAGIFTAFILYKFVAIPIYKSENSSHVSRDELVGEMAEVISPILENGFGEIKYTINSIRYTAPAKHIEGKSVNQGVRTVICKIEQSVFYVSELEEI